MEVEDAEQAISRAADHCQAARSGELQGQGANDPGDLQAIRNLGPDLLPVVFLQRPACLQEFSRAIRGFSPTLSRR